MKNLILLVIISLFILPTMSLAGGELQIEDTQFDLVASTTTQCNDFDIISIRGNVIDMTGKGAGVPDAKVTWKGKRSWGQTTTDVDGGYKLCGLLEGNYTLGAYYEEGFGSGGFTIINFREDVNYYPTGFPANIYLYKGEVYDKGSIRGRIIGNDVKGTKVRLRNKRDKYKGYKAPFVTSEDGVFEFNDLEKGKYHLAARKNGNGKLYDIQLGNNMTYFVFVDW